jgi:Uma2 family endonuclease
VVNDLTHLLVHAVGDRAIVQVQSVVRLDGSSEPQPDVAVLAPRDHRFRHVHPSPADVLLLIEVSDSTLRYDRDVKVPLYARHGIPEVWIVDLQNAELHSWRAPERGRYLQQATTKTPGITAVAQLPGIEIDLSSLLAG